MAGLSLKDVHYMNKQGWSKAESFGVDLTPAEDTIQWKNYATKEQNTRNRQVADVLNIGSGTRCAKCGMLHMCWLPKCGACGIDMDYNLGTVEAAQ
jgi:hypothetical protein